MKQLMATLLTLCSIFLLSGALADADHFCDEVPQAVRDAYVQENPDTEIADCLLVSGMPNGDICLLLTPWSLEGYILKDGSWQKDTDVSPMDRGNRVAIYFRRHEAGAALGKAGEAGLVYPDTLGFDVVRGDPSDDSTLDTMRFHWLGDSFHLVGWQKASSNIFAIRRDDHWALLDKGTGQSVGDARIDNLTQYGLMVDLDDLPDTYAEAKTMEAITRENVENLFDGWTLANYEAYNTGHAANADYYRIDNGLLTLRHVSLSSDAGGLTSQNDSMPVPLSARLLERLQSEPFDTLIDAGGYGDTFITEDAFDQAAISITDRILQNDLQSHGLMLLCERPDASRYLCWVERQADGSYTTRDTRSLPVDASLDLFHSGDNAISLEWQAQNESASFARNADGSWTLVWHSNYDVISDDGMFGSLYCGILQQGVLNGTSGILVGSHPWSDLFTVDFSTLPQTLAEAAVSLDRTGWAVVNNPDPADRLHLRVKPDRAAESLGKFYNHTPVRVLSQSGDWSHVLIGADGRLDGWMMTKYLTFGAEMDAVKDASPQKMTIDSYEYKPLYASPTMKETTGVTLYGSTWWIAGAVDDELYVLTDDHGNTGYMPQSWFFDGNG